MSDFWDRKVVQRQHCEWMALAPVRQHMNELIGGAAEPRWPIDWLESWLRGRTFARALSIGCGTGALERDLVARGLCERVDAFDASIASLAIAKQAATSDRIRYFAADFNRCALPRDKYDAVFFHQSAHHVRRLEWLFNQIVGALKPGGIVYLDEYVGPSRFDWNAERIAPQQAFYRALPRELRTADALALPIQQDDPTEAIRSSSIEPALRIGFDIAARRPYGGTLLSIVLPQMKSTPDALPWCIACERALLAAGVPSFYAVIVARPKRLRLAASMRYALARLRMRLNAEWRRFRARS